MQLRKHPDIQVLPSPQPRLPSPVVPSSSHPIPPSTVPPHPPVIFLHPLRLSSDDFLKFNSPPPPSLSFPPGFDQCSFPDQPDFPTTPGPSSSKALDPVVVRDQFALVHDSFHPADRAYLPQEQPHLPVKPAPSPNPLPSHICVSALPQQPPQLPGRIRMILKMTRFLLCADHSSTPADRVDLMSTRNDHTGFSILARAVQMTPFRHL